MVKSTFSRHIELHRQRRCIMSNLFDREEQHLLVKNIPASSPQYPEHKRLLEAVKTDIYKLARQAVIEKYLSYCRTNYIDQIMKWRVKYHSL